MIVTKCLTSREKQVIELLAEGWTNHHIRKELFLAPKTLAIHIGAIYSKLGLSGSKRRARHPRVAVALLYYRESRQPLPNNLEQWEHEQE